MSDSLNPTLSLCTVLHPDTCQVITFFLSIADEAHIYPLLETSFVYFFVFLLIQK